MPKQRVLKNRNGEQEQPQQQEQHMGKGQQQSMPTNKLQQQPPRKMTIIVKKGGQPREYHYRTTVNSFEELDKFRFENYCRFTAGKHRILTYMSFSIPCTRNMSGKHCDFELRAYRSSNDGNIDVYAYSQHNHPLESNIQRLLCTVETEPVPDRNPPTKIRTADNIEWILLQTLPDYDTMDKFRRQNNCFCKGTATATDRSSRIRSYCTYKFTQTRCKFMMLTDKTTKHRYHVYSYGKHNHPVHTIKKRQKAAHRHRKQKTRQEQMEDEDEQGEVPMEEEQEDEPIEGEQYAEVIAQPDQEEQMETEDRQYPLEKCQRRLQKNLSKDNMERTKKWMGRIDRAEIGKVIAELEVENVANLMRIADIDICNCEASLDFWLPWIKKAIRKKASQKREAELVKFIKKFKHLRKIESLPDKLKVKIQKMLDQRRLEIEAQKIVPVDFDSG